MFTAYNHNFARDAVAFYLSLVPIALLIAIALASHIESRRRRPARLPIGANNHD